MTISAQIISPLLCQNDDGGEKPTSPKQFDLYEIAAYRAIDLNKIWHSRLPNIDLSHLLRCGNLICYGACFKNRIYAVAIWTYPIAANRLKDGFKMLELRRMAISEDAPRNTASRMISLMLKNIKIKYPKIIKVISYQDTEVHLGTIYKASGWIPVDVTYNTDWTNRKNRHIAQTPTPKIRWEKEL